MTSYLEKYDINDFNFVFTSNHVFGKEKSLKKICKKAGINPEQNLIVYIGDEVRDIEAAKKAKFTSIGVSWGYNSETLLRNSCPDFLCNTSQELVSSLMKLYQIEFQSSNTDLSVCN